MNVNDFLKKKKENKKITMVTAYNYPMAKMADDAGIDAVLVGDSLGMVMLGYENTIPVTMEDMIVHCKAVARGLNNAMLVCDMPFMSYQISSEEALRNAGRLMQEAGAHAVKLEGGVEEADLVKRMVDIGIPVMGHIGMTPQSVYKFGGFKAQGKTVDQAKKLIEDAKALQKAGAFAVVLEVVPEELAEIISKELYIPTIGIGAGNKCDGQVQVITDVLGITAGFVPKHSKQFADLYSTGVEGLKKYIASVEDTSFPEHNTCPHLTDETLNEIKKG